jgi:hypothetical protein
MKGFLTAYVHVPLLKIAIYQSEWTANVALLIWNRVGGNAPFFGLFGSEKMCEKEMLSISCCYNFLLLSMSYEFKNTLHLPTYMPIIYVSKYLPTD